MIRNRLLAEERRLARMKARQEEEQARQQQSQQNSQIQVEQGTQSIADSEQGARNSTDQFSQREERSPVSNQQDPSNFWGEDDQQNFDNLIMDQI